MVKLQRYAIVLHILLFIAAASCALLFNQGDVPYDGPIGFLALYVIAVNALFGFGHGLVGVLLCTALSFMSRYTPEATALSIVTNGDFLAHFAILVAATLLVGLLHDKYMLFLLQQKQPVAETQKTEPSPPITEAPIEPVEEPVVAAIEATTFFPPDELVQPQESDETTFFPLDEPVQLQVNEEREPEPEPAAELPPEAHTEVQSILWAEALEQAAALDPPTPEAGHGFVKKGYVTIRVPTTPPKDVEYRFPHKHDKK